MSRIELDHRGRAPIERVFDLNRSIDVHMLSTEGTDERAVAGVTSGLIELGQTVTWSARHFGVRQRLTSIITACDRPTHFRDEMVRGAFRRFAHDHWFEEVEGGTRVRECFDSESPLGWIGRTVSHPVLTPYMRRFLERRAAVIKDVAESERWREFLPH